MMREDGSLNNRRGIFAFIGIALLMSMPGVRANEGPPLAPAKPVVVLYQLTGISRQQGAQKMQVSYGSEGRVRMDFFRAVENKVPFVALIYDPPSDRITTVLMEKRGYVQRDVGNLPSPGSFLNAKMSVTRSGSETVAGLPCTDWKVTGTAGGEAVMCVTDDGVVLRATRDLPAKGMIEAMAVSYETPSPDLFVPPADYTFIPSRDFPNIKPPQAGSGLAAKPSENAPSAALPTKPTETPSTAQTATVEPGKAGTSATPPAPARQTPPPPAVVTPAPIPAPPTPPLQAFRAAGGPAENLPALPTRDVVVTYRVGGASSNDSEKLVVSLVRGGAQSRIDYFRWAESKDPTVALIFSGPDNRLTQVQFERRTAVDRSIGDAPNPAAFVTTGTRLTHPMPTKVAGAACTDWTMQSADGKDDIGSACLTGDGVLLRLVRKGSAGSSESLTATAVSYATPPIGTFDAPLGFTREAAR